MADVLAVLNKDDSVGFAYAAVTCDRGNAGGVALAVATLSQNADGLANRRQ